MSLRISGVLSAWAARDDMHAPNPPAPHDRVAAVEHTIHRELPSAFHELYAVHDGGQWLNGNLTLLPLDDGSELSVARASDTYRSWGWPIPEQVVVFGNDGCGDPFGVWLPTSRVRPLIVTVGAIFEPDCMGLVGDDLAAFLVARTAYYLLPQDHATIDGLDALEVPESLRALPPDDATFARLIQWASPTISPDLISPYTARLTTDEVHRAAAEMA